MEDILKDIDKRNLGGNWKIKGIIIHKGFSRSDIVNGEIDGFTINPEYSVMSSEYLFDIETTKDKFSLITRKVNDEKGTYYKSEIDIIIPKNRVDLRNKLEELDEAEFIFIITDNNEKIQVIGDIDNSLKFSDDFLSGSNVSDLNNYQFKFESKSILRNIFLASDYTITVLADNWILRSGFWDDEGEWIDEAFWKDGNYSY